MSGSRLLLVTIVGITLGAVAAAAALVIAPSGAGRVERPADGASTGTESPEQPRPRGPRGRRTPRDRSTRARPAEGALGGISLTERFSSDDPAVRHTAALELLRGGDDALAQARALRSNNPEGRALLQRLVASLQALRLLQRGEDFADLPRYEQDALFLKYATRVVPEDMLRAERRATWAAKSAADHTRVARGFAHDGEAALSDLELARARWELEELTEEAYAAESDNCAARIANWLAELRTDKRVAPARIRAIEQRVAELTR